MMPLLMSWICCIAAVSLLAAMAIQEEPDLVVWPYIVTLALLFAATAVFRMIALYERKLNDERC